VVNQRELLYQPSIAEQRKSAEGRLTHYHRPVSPIRVFLMRNYPWHLAIAPLKRYIKSLLGTRYDDYRKRDIFKALARTARTMWHWYPRQNDVLWFTVQRSGFTWLSHVYTVVMAKQFYDLELNLDILDDHRRLFYEPVTGQYNTTFGENRFRYHVPVPRLMHSHNSCLPWTNHRRLVLQIRNPCDILISKYYFGKFFENHDFESYLNLAPPLNMMKFLNSWGYALESGKFHDYLIIRYEELINEPLETFMKFTGFLGIDDIPTPLVEYSIKLTSIEREREYEMKRKGIDDIRYVKMGRSGKINQLDELTADEQAMLLTFIKKHLRYSFGYNIAG